MANNPQTQAELQQALQNGIVQEREKAAKKEVALLSTIAEVANLLLKSSDYKTVLPDVVRLLGEMVEGDRCLIIQELPEPETGKPELKVLAEWARAEITEISAEIPEGEPQLVVEGDWLDLHEQLQRGELTNYIVAEMPEPWRRFLEAQGVVSSTSVPIIVEGQFWGHIDFDNCSEARLYDGTEIGILQTAAEMIAGAIARFAQDEALRRSEERYRTLFEISSEGIYRFEFEQPIPTDLPVDEQVELVYRYCRMVEGNDAYAAMYDKKNSEDLVGIRLTDVHIMDSAKNRTTMKAFVENGYQVRNAETEEVVDGNPRYFLNNLTTVIKDGYALGGWGAILDITELRLAQQALLQAEQERVAELAKTNQALKNSLDRLAADPSLNTFLDRVLSEISQQLQIHTACFFNYDSNIQTLQLSSWVDRGIVQPQQNFTNLGPLAEPISVANTAIWKRLTQTKRPAIFTRDNAEQWMFPGTKEWQRQWTEQEGIQSGINILLALGESPLGILCLFSARRSEFTEEELELAQAFSQQATLVIELTRLANEAQQAAIFEERNRLAGEIHDTLAQAFTGISLQLGVAKSIAHQDPVETQRILDRSLLLAQAGLSEARRAVWAIYPSATKYTNLCQRLREAVQQFATNIPIQLSIEGEPYDLPAILGLNLTRMAQEAIANALKRAQANTIEVTSTYEPKDIYLSIKDDGCGFSSQQDGGGFGLMSLSQRSERIGGELQIHRQLEQGTEISVRVDLEKFTELLRGKNS